jgi:hypothetical protein
MTDDVDLGLGTGSGAAVELAVGIDTVVDIDDSIAPGTGIGSCEE